ncbi:hypothetical protein [Motilimonas eburnea]|uniref:hypothetical protein n=1 Tax=Motilimonas eburnea TaxID=1737488 RepID=UPI001E506776|nr:hypothetical protein [Motilimonas eburnea]MCE2571759.1 hypothetical protein [Motilimonas eburnea]
MSKSEIVTFEEDIKFDEGSEIEDLTGSQEYDAFLRTGVFLDSIKADPLFYWFVTGLEIVAIKNENGQFNANDPRIVAHMDQRGETDNSMLMQYDAILICPQTQVSIYMESPKGKIYSNYHCVVESEDYTSTNLIECAAHLFDWLKSMSRFEFSPQPHQYTGTSNTPASLNGLSLINPVNFPALHNEHSDSVCFLLCPIRNLYLKVLKADADVIPAGQSKYGVYVTSVNASDDSTTSTILCRTNDEQEMLNVLIYNVCYPIGDAQRPC